MGRLEEPPGAASLNPAEAELAGQRGTCASTGSGQPSASPGLREEGRLALEEARETRRYYRYQGNALLETASLGPWGCTERHANSGWGYNGEEVGWRDEATLSSGGGAGAGCS